jgi:Cys-tRNA(Pro)/Cys-tRNA(Cys) deacylase
VPFAIHEYKHDPAATSWGLEAAEALGVGPRRVYKTLIATIDSSRLAVAVLPVVVDLNLKALAAAVGAKKARLADPAGAERATGYVIGGISPLGQRRRLQTVIDEGALQYETIFVSAGRRGLQIELSPLDLVALTRATTAPLTR